MKTLQFMSGRNHIGFRLEYRFDLILNNINNIYLLPAKYYYCVELNLLINDVKIN